ncbi:hypothetical protein Halru_0488 [Halovivax ruber XH-70]|uniref:DUF1028 domain-containing protein n=1 Tax=Halovivax ruber (strain DSM 18193 / JCM 13892 / XH-70) TaxID=797302 RepID=L0I8I6_HALRX|nr:DUF1028 domain-containing protein [Halovivax ruber]AGB15123.1 hypothetical protein Halru_0488 [Halovivax ruber XH-70]
MTFSLCVGEHYEDDEGNEQHRFGVAVTTRLPAVGTLCPFVSENGAIATQSLVNVDLGQDGIAYVDDGLAVDDALSALLAADDGAPQRQLHGVDADSTFVFSGDECKPWYGHREGDRYTVAGNLLTGESVIESVAETYEAQRDEDRPLAERLIDALEAGQAEGGDKRADLEVQSAALLVADTQEYAVEPSYNDLREDASREPIADLRETYELAVEGHEALLERYEDAYEEDSMDDVSSAE